MTKKTLFVHRPKILNPLLFAEAKKIVTVLPTTETRYRANAFLGIRHEHVRARNGEVVSRPSNNLRHQVYIYGDAGAALAR